MSSHASTTVGRTLEAVLSLGRPVRRPARRGQSRPGLSATLRTLDDAAFARAQDGLMLDRPTAPARKTDFAELHATPAQVLDLALDHALREAAHGALCHGWRTVELLIFARSRVDATALAYLGDVLGLAAQWSASSTWLTELSALDLDQWWTCEHPHATQFARRHELDRHEQLRVAVDVLALLGHLPRTVAVQPETPAASGARPGLLVRDRRIIGKIDALWARAARTSFGDEAEACAVKAQDLLLRYARPAIRFVRRTEPARPAPRRPRPIAA